MSEEIKLELEKLKNQYPEFFEKISPEFLEFILSEETSSKIAEICLENGIEDEEKIEKIAYQATLALLKQTPKENLAEILEKGVNLNHETAQKIHIEIKRLIFSQIPETQPGETQLAKPFPPASEKEKSEKPSKKDVYREPIE